MPKQSIIDKRMLDVMQYAIQTGKAESELKFMELVGNYKTNLYKIKDGKQNFTKEQMLEACKLTGVSADYLFGFTNKMLRKESKTSPIELLEQAIILIKSGADQATKPLTNKVKK